MSNPRADTALSPTKLALVKIRELKRQLAEAHRGHSGDIAIVSMACRFPRRSNTPEVFWNSLIAGTDEVSEIPGERWDLEAYYDEDPDAPGKMYARKGVFLDNLDLMDPEFFGISPREATWIDPQQRMLLEVSWEALERVGWTADKIGEHTGLFVGWMHNDYQNESSDSLLNLNPYIATGSAGSFLSGRLSYYLGLQGPSLAVDTACSSSLVALHLACLSLDRRECDRALVGGVNAIVSPTTNILTCKLKALSPQGHSRAFDAQADGYLRGEGCGIVAIRRLEDAQRDGDPVLAVIRGSAIGHNGFSSGLTVPNAAAQQRVIRAALEQAGIASHQVDYLEAHGTGTNLGDPIEIQAAAAVLGENRSKDSPLCVGSVKTNIGHLEAAAGMAGLIKVLLAFENETIPAQKHFEEPNPHIPWDDLPVKVATEPKGWPNGQARIAGVSAFGMSGTNAHVVLESPPANPLPSSQLINGTKTNGITSPKGDYHLIPLSGKTDAAFGDLATAYRKWLVAHPKASLADVAFTSSVGRRHFECRAALVTHSIEHAIQLLEVAEQSGTSEGLFQGMTRSKPKVAWQFTGQGSQYLGMAKELYDTQPTFRKTLHECDELLQQWREASLLDVLFGESEAIHDTTWTQPGLFAVELGLARLLQHWGFQPDVVLGHSVGQYAAACVAGIMSWEDGLWLISERGRLIGELPSGGTMAAVFAPRKAVDSILESYPDVSLAALNGTHIVISGPEKSVDEALVKFADREIRFKKLMTSHAFHSSLMDPALDSFQRIADGVNLSSPRIPLICNLTGKPLGVTEKVTGEYWRRHIRYAVNYAQSIQAVEDSGCDVVLEIGPQAILTGMGTGALGGSQTSFIHTLQQDKPDTQSMLSALGALYAAGATPDFAKMLPRDGRRPLILPTYPFQRSRYWGPAKPQAAEAAVHTAHPLLGNPRSLAALPGQIRFEKSIAAGHPVWLEDHQVMGDVVFPGAAYVEMAFAAAKVCELQDLAFEQPLRPRAQTRLQTILQNDDKPHKTIEIHSSPESTPHWTRNFKAVISEEELTQPPPIDRGPVAQRCIQEVEPATFYQMMESFGLHYGPQFQTIQSLRLCETDVLVRLQTSGDLRGYMMPPTVLDGAFHSLAAGMLQSGETSLFLPVGVERVRCHAPIDGPVWCHATWNQAEGEVRTANLTLFNDDGDVLAEIQDLKLRELDRAALRRMGGSGPERLIYEMHWQTTRLTTANQSSSNWIVVQNVASASSTNGKLSRVSRMDSVAASLEQQGQNAVNVELVDKLATANLTSKPIRISFNQPDQWGQLLKHLRDHHFDGGAVDGVAWVLDDSRPEVDSLDKSLAVTRQNCTGLLNLLAEFRNQEIQQLPRGLQLVTRNAVLVEGGFEDIEIEATISPSQSQFWGLGRVIGAEQPSLRCRMIDLWPQEDKSRESLVPSLVNVLLNDSQENQIAIREEQYFAPRLKPSKSTPCEDSEFTIQEQATYLITGGLGDLGRLAGMWLANNGAKHIVLSSRRAPSDEAKAFIEQIESLGCNVHVELTDASVESDIARLFQRFGNELPPLRGVIHAAGVLDDGFVVDQSWSRFKKVLAPKVTAASLLHEFTRKLALDFFVLYSSASSVLGSPGQSNYATANAYLDGLASYRRQQGLPATSVNWGPWTNGMADDTKIIKRLAMQGIAPLIADEAHAALEAILTSNKTPSTVLDVNWSRMRMAGSGEANPLLQELVPAPSMSRVGTTQLVEKIKQKSGAARREILVSTLQEELQEILSTSETPDPDTPLIDMGLDSLMAMEFGTRLQRKLGDDLSFAPTLLFDYPTVSAISDYLLDLLAEMSDPQPVEQQPAATSTETARDDVAIIGMGCRFPGAASLGHYWDNLLRGVDSVGEIPGDRWDVNQFYDPSPQAGKMYTRQGGFIENIGHFDPAFFNISGQEACWIDPQHRLLLEVSWQALEDAGLCTQPLDDANVGVFMGIMSQDYAQLHRVEDVDAIDAFQGAGLAHSAGVGRISYVFGFEGPSIAVDSASSSSLVAVCQAAKSLQEGKCNLALAGGVNAILTPGNSLLLSKAGMLSPDGRCKSFSADADGFGRGEGCGVVVLKRRCDAERDGDRIFAVIRGSSVSHNGFSGGLTTPSGRSQERVIREALADAQISPNEVQYLEAHGTGTELGDPIEVRAAASVFGKGRSPDRPLLLGSVKANIGHLEAAGGVSGLIKTALAMHHGTLPPQLHSKNPSPHVPWDRLPLTIVQQPTPWPETNERIAGVTALGMSGTNAHVVLSARRHVDIDKQESSQASHHLLVLSARDDSALQDIARKYADCLEPQADVELANFCYSALVGRRHFEQRAAIVIESTSQARDGLQGLSVGRAAANVHLGLAGAQPKLGFYFGDVEHISSMSGESLYEIEPVFREVVDRCLRETTVSGDSSTKSDSANSVDRQPGADLKLFALQMALAKLWFSWGIDADLTFGVGVGQYSAACIAGVLRIEDAARLVTARAQLLARHQTVTAGGGDSGSDLEEELDEFEAIADDIDYFPPDRALVCSLTADIVPVHRLLGGSYWRQHCLEPPCLAPCIATVTNEGCNLVLEVGAPLLPEENSKDSPATNPPSCIPSIESGRSESASMLNALGKLYVHGRTPDFAGFFAHRTGRRISLPTYPFQRSRYWITDIAKHVGK